ncbi:hypothetical protein E2320_022235 [Naja naja]|nr:hypothetical protein E2320_022235 [Naja naja]
MTHRGGGWGQRATRTPPPGPFLTNVNGRDVGRPNKVPAHPTAPPKGDGTGQPPAPCPPLPQLSPASSAQSRHGPRCTSPLCAAEPPQPFGTSVPPWWGDKWGGKVRARPRPLNGPPFPPSSQGARDPNQGYLLSSATAPPWSVSPPPRSPCPPPSGWPPPCGASPAPGNGCGRPPWLWAGAGQPPGAAGRPPVSRPLRPLTDRGRRGGGAELVALFWRGRGPRGHLAALGQSAQDPLASLRVKGICPPSGSLENWAGEGHLSVSSQLLLPIAADLLDEVLQLLHQLSMAQRQLVRGDAEDLPERGKGPGGGTRVRVTLTLTLPLPPRSSKARTLALQAAPEGGTELAASPHTAWQRRTEQPPRPPSSPQLGAVAGHLGHLDHGLGVGLLHSRPGGKERDPRHPRGGFREGQAHAPPHSLADGGGPSLDQPLGESLPEVITERVAGQSLWS